MRTLPYPLKVILLLLPLLLFTGKTINAETVIERLERYDDAIVTVQGRTMELSPNGEPLSGIDPKTGQIVSGERRKAKIFENTGAGVILSGNGVIATNTHIIYGSQEISVILNSGKKLPAQVLYVSPQYDFSLIHIRAEEPLTAIEWADTGHLSLGQDIITIGRAPLLRKTISGGTIEAIGIRREAPNDPEFIQMDINHYPGDSGGPVLDRNGRFLGLMSARRITQDRSSLAIPAQKILAAYLSLPKDR